MSVRERRTRRERRAKTWEQAKAWRCTVCAGKITHAQVKAGEAKRLDLTGAPKAFGWVHVVCPEWP